MVRRALSLLALLSLTGCDGPDCGRPICGCWEDATVSLDITVVDQDSDPLEGIELVCVNEQAAFATSGVDGLITGTLETRVSDGCGLERCSSVTLLGPIGDCSGTQSTLLILNETTVTLTCGAGDDDSGQP